MKNIRYSIAGLISWAIVMNSVMANDRADNAKLLQKARNLFYQSVEDESQIEQALKLFQYINEKDSSLTGRSLTYIGALTALKGKHALMPHNKLKWVKRGLVLMDEGVQNSPNDIEALFIHGSTCFFLPFFFERNDDAQEKLRRIVGLLPAAKNNYDRELMKNTINFIEEHAILTETERSELEKIKLEFLTDTSDSLETGQSK